MNLKSFLFAFFIPIALFSQTGPGGVGNSSDNGLWLKADAIKGLADGAPVVKWGDDSGNGNHAIATLSEQPKYQINGINGRPSLLFDGSNDQMIIADHPILDGSVGITYYTVVKPNNLNGSPRGILGKRDSQTGNLDYSYTFFFWKSNFLNLDINTQNNRFTTSPSAYSNNKAYMLGFDFNGSLIEGERSRIFNAGNLVKQSDEFSDILNNSSAELVLGGLNRNYTTRLGGDFSEVIHYNRALNTAERKIVENYLGAKYGITIANDLYTHQADYAGEVAGIGQDDDSNSHNDAQGSAIVRINNPSNLVDGSYLIWGHNEKPQTVNNIIDVDGAIIQSRMERVWAVTATKELGSIDITFDLSSFSPITPTDVRLLIDRNNNGFVVNDVAPIVGAVSGPRITFSGVKLNDNDKFTLGSINFNQTPLPVELTDFHLKSKERTVDVLWTTASELNADYYLLSKSKSGKSFENFAQVKANGTKSTISNYKERDETPYSGISYYQLTQVDFDGRTTVYGPISVNRQQDQSFVLVPNPTNGIFKLKSAIPTEGSTTVSIYSSMGRFVKEITLLPGEVNSKYIDLGLESGVYYIKLFGEIEFYSSLKLVVK
ncbi:T9SS type A sorting domain-containing protein [Brumimicrobium glaciale]|uniref:T9SS type A sorting domain-containing protein n=1 Tax=Brumimicrobium glaciale TaxID=200475 RepID=A0A4V1WFP2_9FLAO|nr:LamG-like jellyroll fold domain-containing protein [Brumimicrobium glaciale]RYM33886.1 T9SS type A sorting domain-containing protein [Brumimicrobium glaciale]